MSPPPVPTAAVTLTGVCKEFRPSWRRPPVRALDALTLSIPAGQIFGLIGPNGSGKSTALKIVAGLLSPTAGECRVFGDAAGSAGAKARLGFLPEAPHFPRFLTAREFLLYCGELSGLAGGELAGRADELLAWAGLAGAAERATGTFSKGMAQRLGVAQAVVHAPDVVLLDEPASGLDPVGVRGLTRLIRGLKQDGRTVVLTSHFLPQIEEVCDRVALLHEGRLLREGAVGEFVGPAGGRLERFYLDQFGGSAS
ncbi:MAG: ABC transporter ATP-binding protein [Opitutae bacterium]|nr:ABC transporter ATP-binding protein [Opitutae bacterium]